MAYHRQVCPTPCVHMIVPDQNLTKNTAICASKSQQMGKFRQCYLRYTNPQETWKCAGCITARNYFNWYCQAERQSCSVLLFCGSSLLPSFFQSWITPLKDTAQCASTRDVLRTGIKKTTTMKSSITLDRTTWLRSAWNMCNSASK